MAKVQLDVTELQKEIVSADIELKNLIHEISEEKFDVSQLSLAYRQASECHKKMCRIIDQFSEFGAGVIKKDERDEFNNQVDTYRKIAHANQLSLRKANASAQRALETQLREELLLSGLAEGNDGVRKRGKMEKDHLVKNSTNVTSNLLSISRMMSDQVQHSSSAIEHLVVTSSTLVESGEEAKSMKNVIHTSSKLLSKYDRRETTDKILIFLTFVFFFACCAYVLQKRMGIPFAWVLAWVW